MDEIPEGLEDLLNSIRGDKRSSQSSAIVLVKKETDLVDEKIDERILTLLGLENVNDIDYGTYKTLLKERMIADRMVGSNRPTSEVELISTEYQRVKNKTGRFKPKKVSVEKVFSKAKVTSKVKRAKVVNRSSIEKVDQEQEKIQDIEKTLGPSIVKIEKTLSSILTTFEKQYALDTKQSRTSRRAEEKLKKRTKEEKLEKDDKKGLGKTLVSKVTQPVKSFFDRILDFFSNVLLGAGALWLIDFLENPRKALQPLINMANGVIDFANGVIDGMNSILKPIDDAVGSIFNSFRFLEDRINDALKLFGIKDDNLLKNIPSAEDRPRIAIPKIERIPPYTPDVQGMSGGGQVSENSGNKITGMGADTQLVALSPREVVMSNAAGDFWGRDTLLHMNALAGGTNKPSTGKVMGFAGGGMISISDTERQALNVLAKYESGSDGYEAVNQYGDKGGRGNVYRFPDGSKSFVGSFKNMLMHGGRSLTDLTVGEVKALQFDDGSMTMRQWVDSGKLHAVGRYQFVGNTLPGVAKRAGIPDSAKFDRNTQDKMAIQLIKERGISPWVGPSDKATPAERSLVAKVRNMGNMGSSMKISPSSTSKSTDVAAPSGKRTRVVYLPPTPNKSPIQSGSSANQKSIPSFSSVDLNNSEMLVIKSMYNIAG